MAKPKDDIYQKIGVKYNLHKSVVETIVKSQFHFLRDVIGDLDDERDIMLPLIGKFKYKIGLKGKKRELGDARNKRYSERFDNRYKSGNKKDEDGGLLQGREDSSVIECS